MRMENKILKRLNKKQKEIYEYLVEPVKLTQREIAQRLKMSIATVKKMVKKIKKIVLEEYDKTIRER